MLSCERSESMELIVMCKLTYNQKLACKYYKAYGALCHSVGERIDKGEADELREIRDLLFSKYKEYDPDNSFDVSKDYDLNAGEIISIVRA